MAIPGTTLAPEVWIKDVLIFKDEGYMLTHYLFSGEGHVFQRKPGDYTASLSLDIYSDNKDVTFAAFLMTRPDGTVDSSRCKRYRRGDEAWKDVLRWVLQGLP